MTFNLDSKAFWTLLGIPLTQGMSLTHSFFCSCTRWSYYLSKIFFFVVSWKSHTSFQFSNAAITHIYINNEYFINNIIFLISNWIFFTFVPSVVCIIKSLMFFFVASLLGQHLLQVFMMHFTISSILSDLGKFFHRIQLILVITGFDELIF